MKHLLIILILFISCNQERTYDIQLFSECDQCKVLFMYSNGESEIIDLKDNSAHSSFSTSEGTSTIEVIDNIGFSFSEIRLNGEIVKTYWLQSPQEGGYSINYSINRQGRSDTRP